MMQFFCGYSQIFALLRSGDVFTLPFRLPWPVFPHKKLSKKYILKVHLYFHTGAVGVRMWELIKLLYTKRKKLEAAHILLLGYQRRKFDNLSSNAYWLIHEKHVHYRQGWRSTYTSNILNLDVDRDWLFGFYAPFKIGNWFYRLVTLLDAINTNLQQFSPKTL